MLAAVTYLRSPQAPRVCKPGCPPGTRLVGKHRLHSTALFLDSTGGHLTASLAVILLCCHSPGASESTPVESGQRVLRKKRPLLSGVHLAVSKENVRGSEIMCREDCGKIGEPACCSGLGRFSAAASKLDIAADTCRYAEKTPTMPTI